MKRRQLLLLLGGTLTSARVPRAQQKTMPMIGFLNGGSADTFAPYFAAFRNGLAAMGYVDGQNVAIEYRNAEGHYDRLPAFAADLVQRNVSAIAVVSLPAVLAAKAATTTIPILFVTGADPVAAGLVASFNRPGGNLTGISQLSPTMVTKQIELLREIVPKAELMGVVVNPTNRIHESQLAHLQAGALVQKIRLSVVRANTEQEIKAALAAATTSHFVEQSLLFHTPDALRLPDRPSIAVLPFTNMSGDPEQEYFADGMVEEIITALSRIRWLFVIARNSTFTYKGQAVDVKQIGRELGVRYVLEGSVRKGGNRVRITAQLIDALTDTHLWADRFDGSLEDIFALQDRVAISVAGVIEPALQAAETARSANRPTNDLTAYDLYLRAYPALWSSSRQIPQALRLLEQAIARDPRYGPALAVAALCCFRLLYDDRSEDPEADRLKGADYGRRALEAAGDDPGVLANAAYALAYFGEDIGAMMALADRAVALNPNSARGWALSAYLRIWAGQLDIALEHHEASDRLSPRARVGTSAGAIGGIHFLARRFGEAVPKLLLAIQEDPSAPQWYRYLAACYAHMGRLDEAREIVGRLRTIAPVMISDASYMRNREQRELLLSGLRMAMGEAA